jgi:hypothetical protein
LRLGTRSDLIKDNQYRSFCMEIGEQAYDDEMVDFLLSNPEKYFSRREQEIENMRRNRAAEAGVANERHITALDIAPRQEINGHTVFSVPAIIRGFKARKR